MTDQSQQQLVDEMIECMSKAGEIAKQLDLDGHIVYDARRHPGQIKKVWGVGEALRWRIEWELGQKRSTDD